MKRAALFLLALAGCSAHAPPKEPPLVPAQALRDPVAERALVAAFERLEGDALEKLAAADPRLSQRLGVRATEKVVQAIGTASVLAEDAEARLRGGSLDLFAFAARRRVLTEVRVAVMGFSRALPPEGEAGAALARPALERELLLRLVDAELARVDREAELGEASADLARGIAETWVSGMAGGPVTEKDAWLAGALTKMRRSIEPGAPPLFGAADLEDALYPLERLLSPDGTPKALAAMTLLRVALSAERRPRPTSLPPEAREAQARAFLGLRTEGLLTELAHAEAALLERASQLGERTPAAEAEGAKLLFVTGRCLGHASRVRAAIPPPERLAICGALTSLTESPLPATLALHDTVVVAMGVLGAPTDRASLLTKLDAAGAEALTRFAAARPVVVLGLAKAAVLLTRGDKGDVEGRARAWLAFGDAPLDIVERELPNEKPRELPNEKPRELPNEKPRELP